MNYRDQLLVLTIVSNIGNSGLDGYINSMIRKALLCVVGNMATSSAEVVDTKPTDPEPEIRITTPTIAPTNVTEVTTGTPAIPIQCMEAINLTLAFRADNKGMNLRPKDGMHNCDTYNMIIAGRPWFRFQAPAGKSLVCTVL